MSKNNTNHRSHHHQTGILHMRKNDGKIEHVAEEVNGLNLLSIVLYLTHCLDLCANERFREACDGFERIGGTSTADQFGGSKKQ